MKTTYAGLVFYDSLEKQEANRIHGKIPFICPRHQLPPFIINTETDTPGTVSSVSLVDCSGVATDVTAYLGETVTLYTATANDYFQYKGTANKLLFPTGGYYVKIVTSNGHIYYSENIIIVPSLSSNVLTTWTATGATAFTSAGQEITDCEVTSGDTCVVTSNTISVRRGEKLRVIFCLDLFSGTAEPILAFQGQDISYTAGVFTDTEITSNATGSYSFTFTLTTVAGDYQYSFTGGSGMFVYRNYAPGFMKIDFSNSKDVGDILYQDDWKQRIWLNTRLNFPANEVIEIGEEKDGLFIPEKVVTKYLYRISDYVGRALHRVLLRLPQHDDITITDEVGNEYTPGVGNIAITAADWVNFDVCHMVIQFNDGADTAFIWTEDMADMT